MKFIHTADWHLGKLVQGVHMTEDQRLVLAQLIETIEQERPDALVIAGDLYDRAVPPTEAVRLLDDTLAKIVLDLNVPVIAVAGNHDSPGRLDFGSRALKSNGLHIAGSIRSEFEPVVLNDESGEIHFHLVPYTDPSMVRHVFEEPDIKTHDDAMKVITERIAERMDPAARHVFVGHAFVTPRGEQEDNTSDSERPLAIGGAEHISAQHFEPFHYTALGHLHKAHYVLNETIRYSGSPMKYSISEEHHQKGFLIVDLAADGTATVEKRLFAAQRDMRSVEGTIAEITAHDRSEDYVFVTLLDETPVLYPMEKVRSVYPNAMHVQRRTFAKEAGESTIGNRRKMDPMQLFYAFYEEVKGDAPSMETEELFGEVLQEFLHADSEREEVKS
ncbi:exonuclease SbcCD subunit D [Planococcus maritimus]|uniref:Nuclease SbcCD subunit D n=1 Tax=Planococcus maritimus TaxID=192421 RepID=A0A7D7MJ78_PLAMR|nr:exonuclease SbcCD subunit D [Planococcus maritimus]QMT17806.1 exonuclease SbcCD subunit D [Planococcus maritimus]